MERISVLINYPYEIYDEDPFGCRIKGTFKDKDGKKYEGIEFFDCTVEEFNKQLELYKFNKAFEKKLK